MTTVGGSGRGPSLLRDQAALLAGHLGSKVAGFVAFAILARAMSRDDYGAIEYLVGLSFLFSTLVETGLGRVGVRRIAERPAVLAAVTAQITVARLGLAAIGVPLMVLAAAPVISGAATRALAWLFAAALLTSPWRQDWLFQAAGQLRRAAAAQGIRAGIFALGILALVRGPADLLVVGWAELASAVAASLYCVAVQHAAITPVRLGAPAEGFPHLVREGAMAGVAAGLGAAIQFAPLFLVGNLAGGEETGWFGAANRIVGSLLALTYVYYFGLYPAIARANARHREEVGALLAASFRVMAWIGTLVALTLTLLAAPLCRLVFGPSFAASGPVLAIMAWTIPAVLLSGHARWLLVASGAQVEAAYAQVAGAIVIAALGIPLVLSWGGAGAAIASVTSAVAVWLVAHAFAARHGGVLPRSGVLVAPGAGALAAIAVSHGLGLGGWTAGLGALALAAAAPVVDRKLWPDLVQLAASRWHASPVTETAA